MKKFLRTFFLCMLAAVTMTVYARAAEDTLKVGLYYGDDALFLSLIHISEPTRP